MTSATANNNTTSASGPAHVSGSTRKLGCGYSLALNTGNGTHMTLVYFNNCKRGYEQDLAKTMANDYFQARGITTIDFDLGEKFNERSVRVRGAEIERIISDLTQNVYARFDIDSNQVPHIDLRGNASANAIQNRGVSVVNNFVY